ncbi:MAG: response regulator [Leptospirales bacterium]
MANTILLVDDSPINITLMDDILSTKSYQVERAYNGEEALKAVQKVRPSLIFLDIQMARMDGIQMMKRLRQIKGMEKTPIIAVSAFNMDGDKKNYIKRGFAEYLSKPISIPVLLRLVEKFVKSDSK